MISISIYIALLYTTSHIDVASFSLVHPFISFKLCFLWLALIQMPHQLYWCFNARTLHSAGARLYSQVAAHYFVWLMLSISIYIALLYTTSHTDVASFSLVLPFISFKMCFLYTMSVACSRQECFQI